MITSFYDGRIRLRDQALKNPETMEAVKTLVAQQDGVLELTGNTRTGSLLVLYDPARISRVSLLGAVNLLEEQLEGCKEKDGPCVGIAQALSDALGGGKGRMLGRRQETALLAAVYGATAASGFVNKGVHIASALLFTGLAVAHIYMRRKKLY